MSDRTAFLSAARDVNNKGHVVGYSLMSAPRYGQYKRATLWENGRAFELEVSPGFWQSQALALSNDGQIAGFIERREVGEKPLSRAATWKQKRIQLLEGEEESAATHINERGQVAGWCEAPDVGQATHKIHAVIWQNGKKFDLGEIAELKGVEFPNPIMPFTEVPKPQKQLGGYTTTPTGFNNLGQIVGKMDIQDGCSSSSGSFFFDGEMHDLKILLPKGENWEYPSASGINDRGQIIGTALHDGKQCVFLLSPNPQK
ncbi:DUF3466 family protein [bacterium]|nr:MAG: DUF3466 family protein [bacterium]